MSVNAESTQGILGSESQRPHFPMLQSSKERLLEHKRAEHEQTRQEHRRRFEEQMHLLESKQQRDEAILTGVEEEASLHAARTLPVTPVKTPAHCEARSRASTINKMSPPLKVFESTRHASNEQLVTPPSDTQNRSPSSFAPVRSVPGSRRTSSNFGLENMNLLSLDGGDVKRTGYLEAGHSRLATQGEPLKLTLPKIYGNEEVPATSYLQMNTTDDSFPILVRRDSYAPLMTPSLSSDHVQESRRPSYNMISGAPSASTGRSPLASMQGSRLLSDAVETSHSRPAADYAISAAVKSQAHKVQVPSSHENRRFVSDTAPVEMRTYIGHTGNASSVSQAGLQETGQYNLYGLMQPQMYGNNFTSYSNYASLQQDVQRHNPYMVVNRPTSFKNRADDSNRYADVSLDSLVGDIYSLCKDQHGCRYLQKKLDERNPIGTEMIFEETYMHAAELMIDPFGNYLCQKLLEHCDDKKRLKIVETVAPELVNISLNMHGTRAVQKLIEFLKTPEQINIATAALNANPVTLIKDLNGNHVIQKCLNRLSTADNQFIFEAVSRHCVEVATHRHGCCVMQRCIDHAAQLQRVQVIAEITKNAPLLVQDPFGNYVVQYVLDLGDARFSNSLIRRFVGNVCVFSVQKFSSNVIEKCLRVAEPETRALLIEELLHKARLEKLLRDSYANYVIQTAIDYADAGQRQQLIDCIKPLLPAIRTTPYGRRIQSKINGNSPPVGLAANFSYAPQVSGFPGYGFRMPPATSVMQPRTTTGLPHHTYQGNYEF